MFYDQIKQLCDERGEKLSRVTTALGFSKGGLSRWRENGNPTADVLLKFADYFGVTVDSLLKRTTQQENEMKNNDGLTGREMLHLKVTVERGLIWISQENYGSHDATISFHPDQTDLLVGWLKDAQKKLSG